MPEKWRYSFKRKVERLVAQGAPSDRLLKLREKARTTYLRRLGNLAKYASASSLVADEETRQLLLARLADARALWEAAPVDEL